VINGILNIETTSDLLEHENDHTANWRLLRLEDTGAALTPGDPVPAGRCSVCEELIYVATGLLK